MNSQLRKILRSPEPERDGTDLGVFTAALYTEINTADGVKEIGKAYNAGITGSQLPELGIVGEQVHNGLCKEKGDQGGDCSHGHGDVKPHTQDAVDGLQIALAMVLGHQDSSAALDAKADQHEDKKRCVCYGNCREGHLAETAHHEVIRQGHKVGDEILQNHGQHQGDDAAVESRFFAFEMFHKNAPFSL